MSRLNEDERRALMNELTAVVRGYTPEWTNARNGDPGITILELFAWLAEVLEFRPTTLSDHDRARLTELLKKFTPPDSSGCTSNGGPTRPRYFAGKLLTAADFQAEQDYVRGKMRRHNRCLGSYGVVSGLEVQLDTQSAATDEPAITIAPGCAITNDGEQLNICEPLRCVLRTQVAAGFVVLRYAETAIDPVLLPDGAQEFLRIEEGVAVDLQARVDAGDVAVARLERIEQNWTLDSTFQPTRMKFFTPM